MKEFLFLYPIPEYINWSINWGSVVDPDLRLRYSQFFNHCIDERYRKRGFGVTYAIFNGHQTSDVVVLQPTDRVIEVGMDFTTHTTPRWNGKYPYPDPDFILDQLVISK